MGGGRRSIGVREVRMLHFAPEIPNMSRTSPTMMVVREEGLVQSSDVCP
jgi:hypothetical protein